MDGDRHGDEAINNIDENGTIESVILGDDILMLILKWYCCGNITKQYGAFNG